MIFGVILPESEDLVMLYYVYILSSFSGVLYIGVTNNLVKRVFEHKQGFVDGFTKKYKVNRLIYYEKYQNIQEALNREKRIKHWKRAWKLELIYENESGFN